MAVMDWGGANSRFLGLVSVWAARSFDQTALRPSVIKRIRQIDVKYITHITSFGVTAWTRVTAWTCMCELPRCTVHWTRISIHWILDFKQLLLLLLLLLLNVRYYYDYIFLCRFRLCVRMAADSCKTSVYKIVCKIDSNRERYIVNYVFL